MSAEQPFRWILAVILVVAISISGYYRKRARETGGTIARRQESGRLIALRLAFGLPLLLSLMAFLLRPGLIGWAKAPLPLWVRWGGAALGVTCIVLVVWVMRSIGANVSETVLTKEAHELVTHGPYRWVRHPLYAVGLLLLLSAALMASSWLIGALTAVAGIAIRTIVIPVEETALIEKFGDRYREYMGRTGRLIPPLRE
jgi:protein-S-isoprenylcysteine O-methyltransferase Ste14